jgi:murein DD-endopeptidase MepM/ murein hydrolase activator NlpD
VPSGDGDGALVGPDEAHVKISYTLIPTAEPFSWPVEEGVIRSPFGRRHGRLHAGVDISAPPGCPVHAARDGVVIYSGSQLRGYGNLVMIDHEDGFVSLYAHNSKNLARKGDRVTRGDTIARVGATGNATGSHCHFEVRRDNVAIDPMQYLSTMSPDELLVARGGAAASGSGGTPVGATHGGSSPAADPIP